MGIVDVRTGAEGKPTPEELRGIALRMRQDIILCTTAAGSGHPGGSLSAADFLTALYFREARHDPANPGWPGRDRIIFSKAHITPAIYSALALSGYFPEEDLAGFRRLGSPLQGHPDRLKLPGIEISGGSLGQGLGVAAGCALSARMSGLPCRVYAIMGDGEQQEGSVWEAAGAAAHYRLDNLCGMVDKNGLQIDGRVCDVMNIEPLADRYRAFGWHVVEADGHDMERILSAFGEARAEKGRPTVILMNTVKGKGVSFMENEAGWHGRAPDRDEGLRALGELGADMARVERFLSRAGGLGDRIALEHGSRIPSEKRPYWWNSQDRMRVEMRATRMGFGDALEKAGEDPRVVAFGADISDSICMSRFHKPRHPERKARWVSAGIAEQNMTAMAAGLAREGWIPVIGSYGVFATGRNWDQLRTTVCYGNLNVKVAVAHGGISVGPDGATHQSLEDITLTAILPNMSVAVPADAVETAKMTEHLLLRVVGPCCIRFAREATPVVTGPGTPLVFGKANVIRFRRETERFVDAFETVPSGTYASENEDATVIACGPEVPEAMRAAYILKKEHDLEVRVLNLHTVKPLDSEALVRAAAETGALVIAEEHQRGGLGNIVAGALANSDRLQGRQYLVRMIGMPDAFGESGQPWELIWKYGLAAEHIADKVLELVELKRKSSAQSAWNAVC
ncbi:MAG: transketolase [Euryarchaeota archaeon]|nr:transketolase [Euryarchaeota archaeon]